MLKVPENELGSPPTLAVVRLMRILHSIRSVVLKSSVVHLRELMNSRMEPCMLVNT